MLRRLGYFGAISPKRALLALALVSLSVAGLPASASASVSHVFKETFGGAVQPSFTQAEALAVDQSTGDLLVVDTGANNGGPGTFGEASISRYHADGTPADFSVLGSNVIDGKGGADKTPQEGLQVGNHQELFQLVVDNSGGATDGDIYLTQRLPQPLVDVFAPDGHYLGQLTEFKEGPAAEGPLKPFEGTCGVAVDSSGNVFVSDFQSEIHKFTPSANPVKNVDSKANFPMNRPCTLVAGAGFTAGSIFVNEFTGFGGSGHLLKLDATTGGFKYQVGESSNSMVTVDPASGRVYVVDVETKGVKDEVKEFDASGAAGATLLDSFGGSPTTISMGIAINAATGDVYLSRFERPHIEVWETVISPDASTEAATAVGSEAALLHGTLSAAGGPPASCEFQYTTEEAFKAKGFTGATSIPCSPTGPFTGSGSQAVTGEATNLAAGTEYRFRLLATNEKASKAGQALAFTTSGPRVVSASVEAIGIGDATLSARVNPHGQPSSYHVEYGTTNAYGQSSAESLPIGFAGDESVHTVSVHIAGLSPGTAYHFRFLATNVDGSSKGDDQGFTTYAIPSTFAPCPNDQYRGGFGARLPDCRAFEQATPTDKHGANVQGNFASVQAASGGDRITFYLNGGLPTTGGSSTLSGYMASRGPSGWSSDGLLPATAATDPSGAHVIGWSDDLATTAVTAAAPGGAGNAIYLRDSDSGAFGLTPVSSSAQLSLTAFLAGYAADTQHLIFESTASDLPGAIPGKSNLYELDHGVLTLPGRIPTGGQTSCDDEGGPACVAAPDGAAAGPYQWAGSGGGCPFIGGAICSYYTQNTISRDGSKVFFTAGDKQLYVREGGTATTQVSASQRSVPDPNGEKPAAFMAATPDGSKVFFTSCEKLTDDSTAVSTAADTCTAGPQGQDLYSYDTGTGELTDLSTDPNASDAKGADVQGVLGTSEDGSYVYFVANGVLAEGASPGSCGDCNLYLSHDGVITFIAALKRGTNEDELDWIPHPGTLNPKGSRVSADGQTLLFLSYRSLTGYDNGLASNVAVGCTGNVNIKAGEPCAELFRYRAPGEELTCVSCDPTGAPPHRDATVATFRAFARDNSGQVFLTRNLSADGNRAFFESPDALVPADTNGVIDPYEWEAEGSGSCHSAGGCIYLLSSGTSPDPSYFGDASSDGDHVFIFTDQPLVPGDNDQLYDIYDAAVGGGLASQHALTPPTCSGFACQANPAPPLDLSLASASFQGPGNVREGGTPSRRCPKGTRKVRRAGKAHCLKAHKQRKRHSNRGGSK